MKAILNPKFKKNQVISLQDSSSEDEEGKQSKELESVLNQVLNILIRVLKKFQNSSLRTVFKILEMRIWKRIPHHYSLE